METNRKKIFFWIIGVIIVVGGLIAWQVTNNAKRTARVMPLAQCIADSGAKFYGAFWCPVCNAQKKAFFGAAKILPYVECSNPDKSQTEACTALDIKTYPTWEFKDKSRLTGNIPLATLAEKTACALPEGL